MLKLSPSTRNIVKYRLYSARFALEGENIDDDGIDDYDFVDMISNVLTKNHIQPTEARILVVSGWVEQRIKDKGNSIFTAIKLSVKENADKL